MSGLKLIFVLLIMFLVFSFVQAETLKEAVNAKNPSERIYELSEDEYVAADLGNLGGTKLTIYGNGYDINGNDHSGITVSNGKTLNIENINSYNNFNSVKGGAIYNNYGATIISRSTFSENTASDYGGVIYNNGNIIIIISSSVFLDNTANDSGGAIYNVGVYGGNSKITISSSVFSKNTAKSGGAIYNGYGTVIISSSVFSENTVNGNGDYSDGGALYNSYGTVIISSSVFSGNNTYWRGGAISNSAYYNDNGTVIISSSIFSENTTSYCGGAIYNGYGTVIISSSVFSENTVNGNGDYSDGGAIYNGYGTVIISSSVFSENTAKSGGAIHNGYGTVTISSSVFLSNNADNCGGAIFNCGVLNLIADINTGNKADNVSNAIHDNSGTINLWASKNADIIFNDRITSKNNTSILNVNKSSNTLPTTGKIVLNENMSGYTGTVNLYGGEIELTENGTFFNAKDLNLSGGTLNIENNKTDSITVQNFSSDNTNLKIDVDLSNNTSDNFTVSNTATGTLNIKEINIINVLGDTGSITIFNNLKSPKLNILTVANYDGYEYTFTESSICGILNYEKTGKVKTFKETINDTSHLIKSYSLSANEEVTEGLGELGGEQLTIYGNGYDINGNEYSGITISNGQILNIGLMSKIGGNSDDKMI